MRTKHDLSHDIVTIDYPTLLETVQAAVYMAKGACQREMSKIDYVREEVRLDNIGYGLTEGYYIAQYADNLALQAALLAKAAGTLEVLEGMKCRSKVKFVNKPEVIS